MSLEEKELRLSAVLQEARRAVVAFSGGVDSSMLLYAAHRTLGDNATAVTIATPYIPEREIEEAKDFCRRYAILHKIIMLDFPDFLRGNPLDRCYHCKHYLFSILREFAERKNAVLMDGTNYDDSSDYRPGLRALSELGVSSPLLEVGLSKKEIRGLSEKWHLPTADKPAYACLLTRLPFDTRIEDADLERIESAEKVLFSLGFQAVRVRQHGDMARIELAPDRIAAAVQPETRQQIVNALQASGYRHVTLDLNGYRMGSFNPA